MFVSKNTKDAVTAVQTIKIGFLKFLYSDIRIEFEQYQINIYKKGPSLVYNNNGQQNLSIYKIYIYIRA